MSKSCVRMTQFAELSDLQKQWFITVHGDMNEEKFANRVVQPIDEFFLEYSLEKVEEFIDHFQMVPVGNSQEYVERSLPYYNEMLLFQEGEEETTSNQSDQHLVEIMGFNPVYSDRVGLEQQANYFIQGGIGFFPGLNGVAWGKIGAVIAEFTEQSLSDQ